MYSLRLQAVDSRIATPQELKEAGITSEQIPTGWRILAHQAKTVKALRYGDAPIVINRAMTGDGKTMAGRFQLLSEKSRTFAMYPTNELAHDQASSFDELMREWSPPAWQSKLPMQKLINASEIDEFTFGDEDEATRPEKIKAMLRHDYVLTNPDIFHLIMSFAYQQQGVASDFLPTYVADRFPLYIFDEFHLFGVEQTASVMIAMSLLRRLAPKSVQPRYLFLSATPQELLTHLAHKIGLDVALIEGEYEHGLPESPVDCRRILRKVTLNLHTGNLEEWVTNHFDSIIKPFFLKHLPSAKGVIIANSVATAHRIYQLLKPLCAENNIPLGKNTGLTPKPDRSRDFDLLVATSTVDVGVDFKINFLVFESFDAASHQQRLGRLGRHEALNGTPFAEFEAHALLPPWAVEGLRENFPDGSSISREAYKDVLQQYFQPLQDFAPYIHRWAGVQAGHLLAKMSKDKYIRAQYKTTCDALQKEYKTLFGKSLYKIGTLSEGKRYKIIDVMASFRGGSPFTALVKDVQAKSKYIMSYNLISLLANAHLKPVPIDELLAYASNAKSFKKADPLAAYHLIDWRDKRLNITFELDSDLPTEACEVVFEQDRFRLVATGVPELQALNKELYKRTWVALFIPDKKPYDVRRLLRLGLQIELFELVTRNSLRGTVAFGRDAMLLDSVLFKRKQDGEAFIW